MTQESTTLPLLQAKVKVGTGISGTPAVFHHIMATVG